MSLKYVIKLEQKKLEILNIHYKTYSVTKMFPISLCMKNGKKEMEQMPRKQHNGWFCGVLFQW